MMLFADQALARRIEAGEARVGSEWAQAHARLSPESGAVAEVFAGGCAVFAGIGSPISQAHGLGIHGVVTATDLDRLESFYRSRGSRVQIIVCPLADPSLLQLLGQRGYRLTELENVLVKAINLAELKGTLASGEPAPPAASGVQVREVGPADAVLWARTVAQGFVEQQSAYTHVVGEEADPKFLEIFVTALHTPGTTCFLAFVHGEVAGGGGLSMYQGVAMLNGASTLPTFRKRGVHSALHHARLAFAAAAGCDLARVVTQPGSTSQRNAERKGFQVVYTRATMVREWAEWA